MNKTLIAIAAMFASLSLTARTLIVDQDSGPYTTIQAAVDAATDGDVIEVHEGIYSDGVRDSKCGPSRVYVDKTVTIRGTNKENTIIEGVLHNGIGCGDDSVRGMLIATDEVRVENITFKNCSTKAVNNDIGKGGGVHLYYGCKRAVFVDCNFIACVAYNSTAYLYSSTGTSAAEDGGIRAYRCYFSPGDDPNIAIGKPAFRNAALYWCVMDRHFNDSAGNNAIEGVGPIVNCTFRGFLNWCVTTSALEVYNSILEGYIYRFSGETLGDCVLKNTVGSFAEVNAHAKTIENCYLPGDQTYCFLSTAYNDYRLNPFSKAVGRGSAEHLELIPLEFRYKDFNGNTVDPAGPIHAGAIQEVVDTPYQRFDFRWDSSSKNPTKTQGFVVDGVTNYYKCAGNYIYDHATVWPKFYDVKPVTELGDECVMYLTASGADGVPRWPEDDKGNFRFMANPTASAINFSTVTADKILYVDASAASGGDGSKEKPYQEIQQAIDAVAANGKGIIHVAEGVYSTGGAKLSTSDVKSRVCISGKNIRILGAGADKTFIVGEADPSAASGDYGCGANAVRCVAANAESEIKGVTLTGGHTMSTKSENQPYVGGAVFCSGKKIKITDCVISNNYASIYGAVAALSSGWIVVSRCKVFNNYSTKSTGWGRSLASASSVWAFNKSMVGGNRDMSVWGNDAQGENYDSTYYTIADAFNFQGYLGTSDGSITRNSIAMGFGRISSHTVYGMVVDQRINTEPGSTVSKTTYTLPRPGGVFVDGKDIAKFVDPDNYDFRVKPVSAAVDFGFYNPEVSGKHYKYATCSIDGVWPDVSDPNVKFNAGAYRKIPAYLFTQGSGISPDYSNGIILKGGEEIEFTATRTDRPLLGFLVNGETNKTEGVSFVYKVPADPQPVIIQALYDNHWWVDAVNGSDANQGNRQNPLKTLARAYELSDSTLKDIIHVMPGVYNSGYCLHDGCQIRSRVEVKDNVSLIAEGKAEETIIVGEKAPSPDKYGCGVNATRCVYAGKNSLVRGFTLTGGYGFTGNANHPYSNNGQGGGIYASSSSTIVESCIISNNMSSTGAAGVNGIFRGCLIAGNQHHNIGNTPGLRDGYAYSCIFEGNIGMWTTDCMYVLDSCTFGTNNANSVKDPNVAVINRFRGVSGIREICNTLVMHGTIAFDNDKVNGFSNCVFLAEVVVEGYKTSATQQYKPILEFTDCVTNATPEDLGLDAGYVPIIGSSILVDKGASVLYDAEKGGDLDYCRNRRIANGNRIDIGAVEADWRGLYSRKLGSRISVTDAESAVDLGDYGVIVPAGSKLLATVGIGIGSALDKRYIIRASLDEGCSCMVVQDDVEAPFSPISGEVEEKLTAPHDRTKLVFDAYGAGSMLLKGVNASGGGTIIVR